MADSVLREYSRFVAAERRAGRLPAERAAMREGEVFQTVFIEGAKLAEFARVAARRGAGLVRPTQRTEIVWVDGANQLAIDIGKLDVRVDEGQIHVCHRGALRRSRFRRRRGAVRGRVRSVAGGALRRRVEAAHRAGAGRSTCGATRSSPSPGSACSASSSGIAAATGKDARGNLLVPVELVADARGVGIVPMARHRFAGSSGLKPTITRR